MLYVYIAIADTHLAAPHACNYAGSKPLATSIITACNAYIYSLLQNILSLLIGYVKHYNSYNINNHAHNEKCKWIVCKSELLQQWCLILPWLDHGVYR